MELPAKFLKSPLLSPILFEDIRTNPTIIKANPHPNATPQINANNKKKKSIRCHPAFLLRI